MRGAAGRKKLVREGNRLRLASRGGGGGSRGGDGRAEAQFFFPAHVGDAPRVAIEADPAASHITSALSANVTRRNILFLISDDFRPSSGAYGNQFANTPNLDRLAAEGTVFRAAHVQFAYCAPSRNSFMSGRRPDATKSCVPPPGNLGASAPPHVFAHAPRQITF